MGATSTAGLAGTADAGRTLLRDALKLDAVVTGGNGVAYLLLAEPLEDLLGLSPGFLRAAGAFLVLFTVMVWIAATRREVARAAVWAVVAVNVGWALGSVVTATAGWGSPTTVGTVWAILQALVVGGFAALQLVALRIARAPRSRRR